MLTINFETEQERQHAIDMLNEAGYKQVGGVYYRNLDGLIRRVIIGDTCATVIENLSFDRRDGFDRQAYQDAIDRQMIDIH